MPRYYCHECCTDIVNFNEAEWKCNLCETSFIEEIIERPLFDVQRGNRPSSQRAGNERPQLFVSQGGDLTTTRPTLDLETVLRTHSNAIGPNQAELLQNLLSIARQEASDGPASEAFLNRLQEEPFTELLSQTSSECAICMGEYEIGEMVVKVPCGHFFHSPCIRTWLNVHNTCPVCRSQFSD